MFFKPNLILSVKKSICSVTVCAGGGGAVAAPTDSNAVGGSWGVVEGGGGVEATGGGLPLPCASSDSLP